MKKKHFCVLLLPLALHTTAVAQDSELEISAEEFPRIPAVEPADVMSTFELEPGFKMQLSAHEPNVMDPIAMTFDERGRAYVLEMRGYSERREEALGQVRLLTDKNGDGIFDQSSIFKEGLKWPTAITCYKGGVFVGATPDIYYLKDTDGDGVCDEQKTVFTGFGGGNLRLNMQALFNSLRWGPDNRIWGATARNGGLVSNPNDDTFEPVLLRGADFSFDPEKLDLRAENGTAQYGMSFDSEGRRYVCSNSKHIVWVAYERHQVNPNPWYSLPDPLVDIPNDGAAAPVYRISPDEPWRIVRTRWRVAGVVKGVVEGGGRVSGYFTSATGVHLYWGTAFPDKFRNNAFIGDVGSNLVHRKVIDFPEDSVQPIAHRENPEEKTEFLRSADNWFRPTSFATGPDGALYLTDMYRETIEHPWSLPEPIKKHLDLNSGFDRGRIYRITPEDFISSPPPDLAGMGTEELENLANHPNDWTQTTARRLLFERGQPALPKPAVEPFPALLSSKKPLLDHTKQAATDPWIRAAFLNSLKTSQDLAKAWTETENLRGSDLRIDLAEVIGRSGNSELISTVATELAASSPTPNIVQQIVALQTGMKYAKVNWLSVTGPDQWKPLISRAMAVLQVPNANSENQIAAVRLLGLLAGGEAKETLQNALLSSGDDEELNTAIALAIHDNEYLIDHFPNLTDGAKASISRRIGSNKIASLHLLDKVKAGEIALSEVPASLLDQIRNSKEKQVERMAHEVLPPVVSRADVIAEYEAALKLETDRERGKTAFAKACSACHVSHEGQGINLGPPIATFATAGKDSLLNNILDPNKEVAPQYQAYTFELKDEPPILALITSETPDEVTLRAPGGIEKTFPRTQVASMSGLGQSLMPEGLEATLTVQEMADLLAYLTSPAQ
ncbi:MAG: hypothetical protein CMO55_28100 [Verrucomicrobiales bacterium]|nr:hypothetical protein [Verrucomicrobiales bacterium]